MKNVRKGIILILILYMGLVIIGLLVNFIYMIGCKEQAEARFRTLESVYLQEIEVPNGAYVYDEKRSANSLKLSITKYVRTNMSKEKIDSFFMKQAKEKHWDVGKWGHTSDLRNYYVLKNLYWITIEYKENEIIITVSFNDIYQKL